MQSFILNPIILDALIVAISNGASVQLVGTYVDSPLVWSILGTTTLDSIRASSEDIRVGVSRLGSGSHTMAYYLAYKQGWNVNRLKFVVANTFDGLKKGITNHDFDIFLWEHFTTKPSVTSGEIKEIGDVATPWTAFSFASRQLMSPEYTTPSGGKSQDTLLSEAIHGKLFPALCEGVKLFKTNIIKKGQSSGTSEMIERIMKEFGHTDEDAKLWFSRVSYANDMRIDGAKTIESVNILKSVGLVPQSFDVSML